MTDNSPLDKLVNHDSETALETTVRNLNTSVLEVADAIATIPSAVAVGVATALHGQEVLRKRGLDEINQRPVSSILTSVQKPREGKGSDR